MMVLCAEKGSGWDACLLDWNAFSFIYTNAWAEPHAWAERRAWAERHAWAKPQLCVDASCVMPLLRGVQALGGLVGHVQGFVRRVQA